jgi:DNA-binding LacI/PurR family transcriptional regulator
MISMKDISLRCGVSVATVSKALNDHSDISEATKRMVRMTAQEMGYLPNSSARALKTNRTYNIGILFVDRAKNGLTHDYFAHVLDSFKVTAEAKGYDLTFINCNKTNQRMTYLEHSRYRGVDGVVIAYVDFDQDEVAELIRSEIPVVTVDHSFDNKPSVVSDNIGGIRDLVSYIASRGHKRIAYINGGDHSSVTRNRIGAFYKTMDELGIPVREEYMEDGDYRNPGLCCEVTKKLLALPEPPTCIMYPDDLSAIGGINAAKEMGLSIPGDVSIAGYDGIDVARYLEPKITTISQDTGRIGSIAAEKLIGMIEHPKTTLIDRTIVTGELLTGNSVAAI